MRRFPARRTFGANRTKVDRRSSPSTTSAENSADLSTTWQEISCRSFADNASDLRRSFAELRDIWQRGHASDDTPKAIAIARNAFERACRDALKSEGLCAEIIAGARTWRAGCDAPRFLPALPTWLDAKGWEKPPPTKRPVRHRAAVVRRPDMLAEFMEIAREKEAEREMWGAVS